MIPYPLTELLDRFSIARLKMERIGETECLREYSYLKDAIMEYAFEETEFYVNALYDINGRIWDMESDIRKGLDNQLGMEEIGRRAIKIREANKIRVGLKNEVAKKSKSGFKDIKMNHISV
jgi:hypothetical protein